MWVTVVLIVLGLFMLVVFAVVTSFFSLWIQAFAAGAQVTFIELIGMRLRKVPAELIVAAHIRLVRAGIQIGIGPLERHHLAGGDVKRVVDWMIVAHSSGLAVEWDELCAQDLAKKLAAIDTLRGPAREQALRALRSRRQEMPTGEGQPWQ